MRTTLIFTCLYIGITHHSWFTRDSLVYYIHHYGSKHDDVRDVFIFDNMT